ncbi:MAG: hypothetical protein ABL957_09340 [Parvularculaceae bacterium]
MEDLTYIVALGFSGADVAPAVVIAFFVAMFVKNGAPVWKIALLALFLDRFLWPITSQALSGADIQTIYATIGGFFTTFFDNIGVYVVRFFGLVVMIGLFVLLRHRVHKLAPPPKKAKPAAA